MKIISFSPFGYEGAIVTVEVDLRRGIPAVDLVGLADNAVKEARERMRAAIRNSGFDFPPERVLISLSPADVKKEGAGFDLAIALAVLLEKDNLDGKESKMSDNNDNKSVLVMGELELSGNVRAVRGVHAAVSTSVENGLRFCIVPEENSIEAQGFPQMKVLAVKNLVEAKLALTKISKEDIFDNFYNNDNTFGIMEESMEPVTFSPIDAGMDFAGIKGQHALIRALQVAAAGGHNLIVSGPPGCGKTLALQRFPSILPLLPLKQAREVTRIYSLAGLLPQNIQLIREPPFRKPHQSASLEGMAGGGISCRPGEMSLAHNGVLFLDEAAEFRSTVLQALRVPLESKSITLSRAGRHTVFPAAFQLLIATNPCPCGNFGSIDKVCLCSIRSVEQYWKKFSAPLLDRVDIRVVVDKDDSTNPITTEELRKAVAVAVGVQRKRQGKMNSVLTPEEINGYCKLDSSCREFISEASKKNDFSTRALHSCIKIARTIADMEGVYNIRVSDLIEAVNLRKNEGGFDLCI